MSDLLSNNMVVGTKTLDITFQFEVHKLYTKYKAQTKKIRTVIEGSEAVKAAGTLLLPKLSLQSDADYTAYKTRALFFNSSARILNTNVGTVMRRTPTLEYDKGMTQYFEEDTVSFLSFRELFKHMVREVISVSRTGILVEIDQEKNIPIPVRFDTEQIINWTKDENGKTTSVLLVQIETTVNAVTFESTDIVYYYHLYLDADGVYSVKKYDETKTIIYNKQPALRGKTLNYIPFTCVSTFGASLDPAKSPLIDVVDINVSHYCTSADLECGRHFVGLPQPVVTGGKSEQPLHVGSSQAWVIPNDKAKAFYLEFLGQGLDGLAKALDEKESQMAQFSAQLMDTGSKGSEAEGTVRLRYSSDAANISDIAESVEIGLNLVYATIADWSGNTKPTIELNKDFISDKMSYNELRELSKAYLDKSITEEEYRYNLQRGEMLPYKK